VEILLAKLWTNPASEKWVATVVVGGKVYRRYGRNKEEALVNAKVLLDRSQDQDQKEEDPSYV
jgi:hypothetical protein